MIDPSSAWTPEERLQVIAGISNPACKQLASQWELDRMSLFETMERIVFVAGMPARWLEDHRDQILGKSFFREQR